MQLKAGNFIQSTGALADTLFNSVIIFLSEYNADGAVGFITNKAHGRSLHELVEFRHSKPFPLGNGGPVDTEHLFFLHRRPEIISGSTHINGGVYYGGNFAEAVTAINEKQLLAKDVKIFVGYCGWDAGELEAELEEKSWMLMDGTIEDVFKDYSIADTNQTFR